MVYTHVYVCTQHTLLPLRLIKLYTNTNVSACLVEEVLVVPPQPVVRPEGRQVLLHRVANSCVLFVRMNGRYII